VRDDGTTTTTITYYAFGGQTVAMYDGESLIYYLTDHLGSMVVALDSSGNLLSQQRYLPFGEVREDVGTITQTDFGYTSQRSLPELGLMDYRARFYSPALGRFLQADTIAPGGDKPQTWNRFTYSSNNPIRYNDPSGHCDLVCFLVIIGLSIAASQIPSDVPQAPAGEISTCGPPQCGDGSVMLFGLIFALFAPAEAGLIGDFLVGLGLLTNSTTIYNAGVGAQQAAGVVPTTILKHPGMNGNPDHIEGVEYVTQLAMDEFPKTESYEYEFNVSIKDSLGGIDRRPDLTVWKDGELQYVYEVARQNLDGSLVAREAQKMAQYTEYGIESFFYKIPR